MADTLTRGIRHAISDPGSIAGRRRYPGWGEGNDGYSEQEETLLDWQTRAVLQVLVAGRWAPDLTPRASGPIAMAFLFLLVSAVSCGIGSVFL